MGPRGGDTRLSKKTRKKPDPRVETQVLVTSRHRCAFCWGLAEDLEVKKGQLAHVDRDPSKSDFDDLAFLCLEHHDEYDTKASVSKRFTPAELRIYRDGLYQLLKQGLPRRELTAADITKHAQHTQPMTPDLDLYDRRLKLYNAAKEFIVAVGASDSVKTAQATGFVHDVR